MIKVLWGLIGLNTLALLVFIAAYFILNSGKQVDYQEKGWTFILAAAGLLIILLAALPLKFGSSTGAVIFGGFFAMLPLVVTICIVVSNHLPSFKKNESLAAYYYKDKTQRSIAAAIEHNDTSLLKELIKGQDLNFKSKTDLEIPTYLQFALRLQLKKVDTSDRANTSCIRILLANGAAATPALSEAVINVDTALVSLLLEHGADPNTYGFANNDPVLFEAIGTRRQATDVAILLIKNGADVNAKALNNGDLTPMMFAANNARTSPYWKEVWRLVRYLLEKANADYTYTTRDGNSMQSIITMIRKDVAETPTDMPADFNTVVEWLYDHKINTQPSLVDSSSKNE